MFTFGKSGGLSAADLEGTWKIVEGKRGGEAVAAERMASDVIFSKEDITIPMGEDMKFVMAYELVEGSEMGIDMEITEGPQVGAKALGIIKKDGDTVWFCYDAFTGERPENFESTSDNGFFLFKMEPKK